MLSNLNQPPPPLPAGFTDTPPPPRRGGHRPQKMPGLGPYAISSPGRSSTHPPCLLRWKISQKNWIPPLWPQTHLCRGGIVPLRSRLSHFHLRPSICIPPGIMKTGIPPIVRKGTHIREWRGNRGREGRRNQKRKPKANIHDAHPRQSKPGREKQTS